MSQAIEMAMIQVYNTIPMELLDAVFEPRARMMALDECIYNDVITPRVLKECSIYAGKMTAIELSQDYLEDTQTTPYSSYPYGVMYAVYRIPPEAREYKSITTVVSVEFPTSMYSSAPFGGIGAGMGCGNQAHLSDLACSALRGVAGGSIGHPKPLPERLAGDLVKLTPTSTTPLPGFSWMLICRLEYDSELTNLTTSGLRPFVELVEAAVKAYIYNYSILKIDKFYTQGGMELGRVREIIDSYADQNEKYAELLQLFRRTSTILDKPGLHKLIKRML